MTTADAWREIARKLSNPTYDFEAGLCNEVYELHETDGIITWDQKLAMYAQVDEHLPLGGYVWPAGKFRQRRILAALFLACEAERP